MTTDTKALRGLLEKASKGEWNVSHNTFFDVRSIGADDLVCNFFVLSEENHKHYPMDDCEANAELIAQAIKALPDLLDAYEERDRLKELLEECHGFFGQMYEHGVNLPEAGEQHLERVASYVALYLESEASDD